jgi:hypothetical protein
MICMIKASKGGELDECEDMAGRSCLDRAAAADFG